MPPRLYSETEVLKHLKLQSRELLGILEVGLIAPVARDSARQPLYCAETIDRLSTRAQQARLVDALWWDFDLERPGYVPDHLPWAPPADLPFYPFNDEYLQSWARRVYRRKKQCAPFPYPHPSRLEGFRSKMEEQATRAFEKAHGIKRPRKSRRLLFRGAGKPVELSRAGLRDLVWRKTMIRVAADLGMSEFTLRQICKRLQIPTPQRGHFNHKNPRERMRRPLLAPFKKRSIGESAVKTSTSWGDNLTRR